MPEPQAAADIDWEAFWRDPRNRARWSIAEPDIRRLAAHLLPARGIRRVLDLGCGSGRHALLLAAAGFEVWGLDAAHEGLKICRQEATRQGLVLRVQQGQMTALPYAAATFDFVLAFNVLAYGDLARSVAELGRVLARGGLLYATIPFLGRLDSPHSNLRTKSALKQTSDSVVASGDDPPLSWAPGTFSGFDLIDDQTRLHSQPGSAHRHILAERS